METKYRLPRKGDRVRFWELDSFTKIRSQQTGTVVRRTGKRVYINIDGRDHTQFTPTREMEILS